MRLTPFAKVFISVIILSVVGAALYFNPTLLSRVAPPAVHPVSNIPPVAALPDQPFPSAPDPSAGCAQLPEVRFYHWAWNAQMGLMLANGGKQAAAGSLMCETRRQSASSIREDNTDNMQALLSPSPRSSKKGERQSDKGAHFVGIMGDGSAAFLKGLNDKLDKLGPDYIAVVVGSAGYSRGEDKFMGPPAWKENPQAARGGLVAGVLRDGDWNIALKWLGDNKIPNNPDETTYDPDAMNWVNATDYVEAAQKYVSGFCADLKNTKTGVKEKHCVNGVVTWTPGDVTVATKRAAWSASSRRGSTARRCRTSSSATSTGWRQNRKLVDGMLAAIFDAGDQLKLSDDALRRAAAISALVYGEKDAAYWYKYFRVQTEKDAQGLTVELGGSAVNNLADNLQLFGLGPGSTNLFAATYTRIRQHRQARSTRALMPSFDPAEQILDIVLCEGPA